MNVPVYIPTKGRSKTLKTPSLLPVKPTLVVEPSQVESYTPLGYKLLVLPADGFKICQIRQWINDYAVAQGQASVWVMDDDILGFETQKAVPVDAATAMELAECEFGGNVKMVGFLSVYDSVTATRVVNECVYAAILINPRYVSYDCDLRMNPNGMRTDADACISLIVNGFDTVKIPVVVKVDSENEGGLSDEYRSKRVNDAERWLRAKWPKFVTPMKPNKNGHIWSKIKWRKVVQSRRSSWGLL